MLNKKGSFFAILSQTFGGCVCCSNFFAQIQRNTVYPAAFDPPYFPVMRITKATVKISIAQVRGLHFALELHQDIITVTFTQGRKGNSDREKTKWT